MKIECKLRRQGGTHVELEGIKYHFAPQPDGAHVADVLKDAHQDRFLSISEGYRLYRGTEQPAPQEDTSQDKPVTLLGSSVHSTSYEINGKTYALGDVVAMAQANSGMSAEEWNELSDDGRHDLIDEQLDQLAADTNGDGTVDNAEELAALREEYKAKFGRAPHPSMKAASIKAKLAE
ncbi:MAG TPA: hypothetical protein VFW49_14835 [Fluviicoccus sp.]|nr:hypothetical protein [Fluviicoccus sp.]